MPHFLPGFKFLLLIIVFDKFSRVWEGSSGGLSGRFRPFFGGDVTGLGFCLGCSHMILLFGMMVSLGFGFFIFFDSSRASVQAVNKVPPSFITRFCSSLFNELVGKFDSL